MSAAEQPTLWGYGVKTCADYLEVAAGAAQAVEADVRDYGRYREWLAGFVSGINLATGIETLRGAEIDAAMQRIEADCEGKPERDFFNAAMDFVRMLMRLPKH